MYLQREVQTAHCQSYFVWHHQPTVKNKVLNRMHQDQLTAFKFVFAFDTDLHSDNAAIQAFRTKRIYLVRISLVHAQVAEDGITTHSQHAESIHIYPA